MTIKFIGGYLDGRTVELDCGTDKILVTVATDSGFGSLEYERNADQHPRYANSPVEYIAI